MILGSHRIARSCGNVANQNAVECIQTGGVEGFHSDVTGGVATDVPFEGYLVCRSRSVAVGGEVQEDGALATAPSACANGFVLAPVGCADSLEGWILSCGANVAARAAIVCCCKCVW